MIVCYALCALAIIINLKGKRDSIVCSIAVGVVTWIIFLLYFFADNDLPLACARTCETNDVLGNSAGNAMIQNFTSTTIQAGTAEVTCYTKPGVTWTRLVLSLITLFAIIRIVIPLIYIVFVGDKKLEGKK